MFVKRHREITADRSCTTKNSFFGRIYGNLNRQRIKRNRHGVANAEKISKGDQNAGTVLMIPSNSDQRLTVIIWITSIPHDSKRRSNFIYRRHATIVFRRNKSREGAFPTERSHPDVLDATRSKNFSKSNTFVRWNQPIIMVLSVLIPT